MDLTLEQRALLGRAREAARHAYAPASEFKVGAALVTKGFKVYTGANVENAAYGLSLCAERVALVKAVSEGEREFLELVVIAQEGAADAPPCGACRQALYEFAPHLLITYRYEGDFRTKTLEELLPEAFAKGV